MQQQIPMKLSGFPKSDPDSHQFLCLQVLPPRLPFNCVFEVSVDPIQTDFGPFVPFWELRLPFTKTYLFPKKKIVKFSAEHSSSLWQKKKDFVDQSKVHLWCQAAQPLHSLWIVFYLDQIQTKAPIL